jgi:hypothetical protein
VPSGSLVHVRLMKRIGEGVVDDMVRGTQDDLSGGRCKMMSTDPFVLKNRAIEDIKCTKPDLFQILEKLLPYTLHVMGPWLRKALQPSHNETQRSA